MLMALTVGSKGIDFAYNPTGHSDLDAEYSQMVHDGAHFFCRYSAGTLVSEGHSTGRAGRGREVRRRLLRQLRRVRVHAAGRGVGGGGMWREGP